MTSKYRWWAYVRGMVRDYPKLKEEYERLKEPLTGINQNTIPSRNRVIKPTEDIALRELPSVKQREYDAVRCAIETILTYPNAAERYQLIKLIYWDRTYTLYGAAQKIGYSYGHAKRLHTDFFKLVASNFGLLDEK